MRSGVRRSNRREEGASIPTRPKVYTTNHTHSKILCAAFSQGCNGKIVPPGNLLEGPAVVYGILRGCGEIIKQCEWVGRDYYHIDHGYFGRGHYEGYYRVTRNALQCNGWGREKKGFKVEMRPWTRSGNHIVICPISRMVAEFLNIDPDQWLKSVISELSLFTERPIVVKNKDGTSLSEALKDAWCLVTHSSNAAVDSLVSGIPVVTLGASACDPVSWSFEDIESPFWPERERWVSVLGNNQFTIEEMRSGLAWNSLNNM